MNFFNFPLVKPNKMTWANQKDTVKTLCVVCFVAVFSLVLFSCDREIIDSAMQNNDVSYHQITVNEASDLLLNFIGTGNTTKSSQMPETTIADYKVRNYFISGRTTENVTFESVSVPVYEFITQSDDRTGYSIVVADSRIAKVLISVEDGSPEDTLKEVGYANSFFYFTPSSPSFNSFTDNLAMIPNIRL
jgi:hypothetical protein